MRLIDMSNALRRQQVAFALSVALQDITEPKPTMDIARVIARRLETNELSLIGRIVVSMAPKIPQARRGDAAFKRYGKDMRPWIWSPKASSTKPLADDPEAAAAGLTHAEAEVRRAAGIPLAGGATPIPEWDK